ncbi:MAG: Gfo/Idh/MocA family oxidoreductase [Armatimonadota bacterium]
MPTESGKIGFGIIGCGEISNHYVPAAQQQEDGDAVWCMDINEYNARRIGEAFNCPYTTDLDVVLNDKRVDVVVVAVPHAIHKEITIKAARAGKHVMCDKPIATTREDALEMIKVCKECNVKLGTNLASRFQPFSEVAKKIIDDGIIGEVMAVKISAYANKPASYWTTGWMENNDTSWRASKKMAGGGIGIMNMTHEIDRMSYVTGLKIDHVSGEYDTFVADVEVEDTFAGVWRYNNGAIGICLASSNMLGNSHEPNRIFGTKGQLQLWEPVKVFTTREDTQYTPNEWHEIPAERIKIDYIPLMKAWIKAIREDTDPPITGEDGFRVLDAVLGVYDSSDTNKVIFMKKDI